MMANAMQPLVLDSSSSVHSGVQPPSQCGPIAYYDPYEECPPERPQIEPALQKQNSVPVSLNSLERTLGSGQASSAAESTGDDKFQTAPRNFVPNSDSPIDLTATTASTGSYSGTRGVELTSGGIGGQGGGVGVAGQRGPEATASSSAMVITANSGYRPPADYADPAAIRRELEQAQSRKEQDQAQIRKELDQAQVRKEQIQAQVRREQDQDDDDDDDFHEAYMDLEPELAMAGVPAAPWGEERPATRPAPVPTPRQSKVAAAPAQYCDAGLYEEPWDLKLRRLDLEGRLKAIAIADGVVGESEQRSSVAKGNNQQVVGGGQKPVAGPELRVATEWSLAHGTEVVHEGPVAMVAASAFSGADNLRARGAAVVTDDMRAINRRSEPNLPDNWIGREGCLGGEYPAPQNTWAPGAGGGRGPREGAGAGGGGGGDGRAQEGYDKPWDLQPHRKDDRGQEGYEKPWDLKPHLKDERPAVEYEAPWDQRARDLELLASRSSNSPAPFPAPSGRTAQSHVRHGSGSPSSFRRDQPGARIESSPSPSGRSGQSGARPGDSRPVVDYEQPWDQKKQFVPPHRTAIVPPFDARGGGRVGGAWGGTAERVPVPEPFDPKVPLELQSWYHGAISRVDAEDMLRRHAEGSFLVRTSESNRLDFSLSVRSAHGFVHMKVVHEGSRYILGQFSQPFYTIPQMIHHYTLHKLPIKGAEHMSLLYPVSNDLL